MSDYSFEISSRSKALLDVAHKPDEFVPEDEFIQACRIHRDTVLSLLQRGAT